MTTFLTNNALDLPELATPPAAPNAGRRKLFVGEDGAWYSVGSDGEVVPASISLSDYPGVFTIASQNGDFETLYDAVSSPDVPANSLLVVFGSITESQIIPAKSYHLYLTPSAVISANLPSHLFYVAENKTVKIAGSGTIKNLSPSPLSSVVSVKGGVLIVSGGVTLEGAHGIIIDPVGQMSPTSLFLHGATVRSTALTGTTRYALRILGVPGGSCRINGCVLEAPVNAVHSVNTWNNAPFYQNILRGLFVNVSPDAGTAVGSNIVIS